MRTITLCACGYRLDEEPGDEDAEGAQEAEHERRVAPQRVPEPAELGVLAGPVRIPLGDPDRLLGRLGGLLGGMGRLLSGLCVVPRVGGVVRRRAGLVGLRLLRVCHPLALGWRGLLG